MARFAAVAAVVVTAALLSLGSSAAPQGLRTLHVRAFAMSVDRASVPAGELFHLTIRARVGEAVGALDEIVLPNLSAFEELGDERNCTTDAAATHCAETLTLEALTPGDVTIEPATLDAVDARNGRPSRFETNAVRVHVSGAPLGTAVRAALVGAVWFAVRIAALLGLLVAAAFTLAWLRSRVYRAPQAAPLAPSPLAAGAPPIDPDVRLRELVGALAREPTRTRAVAVRAALRERAGAREDETLADLAARGLLSGPAGAALSAIERASFCEDDRVADAAREALPYLLGSGPGPQP